MTQQRIESVVLPILGDRGLELDRLEVIPAGRRSVVRITVDGDGPRGRGPLLDDIASASNAISAALDESDAVAAASYTLEVSSRGLSAPLTEAKHYRRNLTRLVKATLSDGSTLTGRIIAADDEGIQLEVTPDSVKGNRNPKPVVHDLTHAQLAKALVQVEMNRSASEGFDDDFEGDELDDEDDELDDELDEDEFADDDESEGDQPEAHEAGRAGEDN